MLKTTKERYTAVLATLKKEVGSNLMDWTIYRHEGKDHFLFIIKNPHIRFPKDHPFVYNCAIELDSIIEETKLMITNVDYAFAQNTYPLDVVNVFLENSMTLDEFLYTMNDIANTIKPAKQYSPNGSKAEEYKQIMTDLSIGVPISRIAERYNVARNTVYSIKHELEFMDEIAQEAFWIDEMKKYPTFEDFLTAQEVGADQLLLQATLLDEDGDQYFSHADIKTIKNLMAVDPVETMKMAYKHAKDNVKITDYELDEKGE